MNNVKGRGGGHWAWAQAWQKNRGSSSPSFPSPPLFSFHSPPLPVFTQPPSCRLHCRRSVGEGERQRETQGWGAWMYRNMPTGERADERWQPCWAQRSDRPGEVGSLSLPSHGRRYITSHLTGTVVRVLDDGLVDALTPYDTASHFYYKKTIAPILMVF